MRKLRSKKPVYAVLLLLCAVACLSMGNCFGRASYEAIEVLEEKEEEKEEEPEIGAYLDPYNRPKNLQEAVDSAFERLKVTKEVKYNYDGTNEHCYSILEIGNEYKLVEHLLRECDHKRQDFYVTDLGAGMGAWGEGLAAYLIKCDLPNIITVHIISVTAENIGSNIYEVAEPNSKSKVRVYRFGQFKLEDFDASFKAIQGKINPGNWDGQVDFMTASMTFIHLMDPLGTFVQAYNHLRPHTGIICTQGFPVLLQGEPRDYTFLGLLHFLAHSNTNFLVPKNQQWVCGLGGFHIWSFGAFIMERGAGPMQLPMKYSGKMKKPPVSIAETPQRQHPEFVLTKSTKKMKSPKARSTFERFLGNEGSQDLFQKFKPVFKENAKWESIFEETSPE